MRKRNLARRMVPVQHEPAWHPQAKMTMFCDMPLVLMDVVNSVLGPQLRAEWHEKCLNLEISSFEVWKRACGLWKQAGCISNRVALAANSRAEADSRSPNQPPQCQCLRAATDCGSSSRGRRKSWRTQPSQYYQTNQASMLPS